MPNISDAVNRGRRAAGRVARALRLRESVADQQVGPAQDLRLWPWNIRDLVDPEYVGLQTGATYPDQRSALARVLETKPRHAITIHPLIEPTWLTDRPLQSVREWLQLLRTPNSVTALGPFFSLARAGAIEGDKPFDVLRRWLANADEDTLLPTVDETFEITWGAARTMLVDKARDFAAQNERTRPRATDTWDADTEMAFRSDLRLMPLPAVRGTIPTVSIVMPAYNRGAVIGDAIDSVVAQDWPDWELVVVDDGSDDDTREVVEEYSRRDSRVRLIALDRSGVSRARNAGIEQSTGTTVAFLDSDNTWRPDFLHVTLSAMAQEGFGAAYAGIKRYESNGVIRYVGLQAGRDHLRDGLSFIDLNVLVVRRELLDAAGHFDTTLRRWVDYDLVLRILDRAPAKYVPVIGVDYEHEEQTVGRITTSERSTWRDVVLNKYLVDWDAIERVAAERVSGRVSVVIRTRGGWHDALRTVRSVLNEADSAEIDVEVVLVDNASPRDFGAVLDALFAGETRVHTHREANDRGAAVGGNIGFARTTGEFVLFLSAGAEGRRGWLQALVDGLGDDIGALGVVLDAEGTVGDAGVVFAGRGAQPRGFLRGFPLEDLVRSGRTRFVAGGGGSLLLRSADVIRARGFRAHFGRRFAEIDLCLRLGEGQPSFALIPRAVLQDNSLPDDRKRLRDTESEGALREFWSDRWPAADDEDGLDVAGFERVGWSIDGQVGLVAPPRRAVQFSPLRSAIPVLRRLPDRPRRWAIKISTPVAPRGDAWGDTFFAADLARALERNGQEVVVDRVESHFRRTRDVDDVVLTIRGLAKVPPQPGAINVLWVISHPDLVSDEELRSYDVVYAAGTAWAAQASRRSGVDVRPLLQATEPTRFHPGLAEPGSGDDVLFVGTPRKAMRPIVAHAIDAGHAPAIHGHGWEGYVDPALVRSTFVAPDQVGTLYRSSGVVLNDHWTDMARGGFLSNRLFDAAAAGARVVSDHAVGLDDVFGGVVKTYDSVDELRTLLDDPDRIATEDDLMRLSELVRAEHSFEARARTMIADVDALR